MGEGTVSESTILEKAIQSSENHAPELWARLRACTRLDLYSFSTSPLRPFPSPTGFAVVIRGYNEDSNPIWDFVLDEPTPSVELKVAGYIPSHVLVPNISGPRSALLSVLAAVIAVQRLQTKGWQGQRVNLWNATALNLDPSRPTLTVSTSTQDLEKTILSGLQQIHDCGVEAVYVGAPAGGAHVQLAVELAMQAAFAFQGVLYARYQAMLGEIADSKITLLTLSQFRLDQIAKQLPTNPITLDTVEGETPTSIIVLPRASIETPVTELGKYRLQTPGKKAWLRQAPLTATQQLLAIVDYETLYIAVQDLINLTSDADFINPRHEIKIYSDNTTLIHNLMGIQTPRDIRVQAWVNRVELLLNRFNQVAFIWQSTNIVANQVHESTSNSPGVTTPTRVSNTKQPTRTAAIVDPTFFTELKEWSERKHHLLLWYLNTVTKTLGSTGPVYYVDGFAGAGTYGTAMPATQPEKGSPLWAAELAQQYEQQAKTYKLRCINVEADPTCFANLQKGTASFGTLVKNYQGSFDQHVEEILAEITMHPAVIFLDRFGLKGLDWFVINQIVRRQWRTDFWIRFPADVVTRFAALFDKPSSAAKKTLQILACVYGILDLDELHKQLIAHTPLDLYLTRLRNVFTTVHKEAHAGAYPVRSLTGQLKYYLVFATESRKGFTLASEGAYSVEQNYQRDLDAQAIPRQLRLDLERTPTEAEIIVMLQEQIWRACAGRRPRGRLSIYTGLLEGVEGQSWFGLIRSKHLNDALRNLISSGHIVHTNGPVSKDTTLFTFAKSDPQATS